MSKSRLTAYLALLGNTLLWGLAIPIVKKGFTFGLSPTFFLFGRFFFAFLFSLPLILSLFNLKPQLKKQLNFKNLATIILLELLGTFAALWLLYEGVNHTSALSASLIAVTWPIFVTLGGVFFFREKEEKHELAGLLLAVLGTLLLVARPLIHDGNNVFGSTLGNSLILGQNLLIAVYYLLAKKYYARLNLWLVTHISFIVGSLSFGAVLLLSPGLLASQLPLLASPWPLAAILYMAFFGSILGLTLYLIGQNKIEASEASLFTYLQPLVAVPAAIILLSDTISAIEITAAAIIILGVYLAEKR